MQSGVHTQGWKSKAKIAYGIVTIVLHLHVYVQYSAFWPYSTYLILYVRILILQYVLQYVRIVLHHLHAKGRKMDEKRGR